ncbi:MAG: restriction endonuclease subunit S [Methylococcales bacterium]
MVDVITKHIDVWTSAQMTKSTAGRGTNGKQTAYGIKKLRELILELAVRGLLVPQDPNDEPASVLLEKIAAEKARLVKAGKIKKQTPLPEIGEDEKPFDLPKEWEWARLGEVTNYGIADKAEPNNTDDTTWVLELEDIEKETSKLLQKVRYADRRFMSSKNRFSKNDVIYGKLRPYLDKVIVADEDGVCTTEMIPVRGHDNITPQYLRLVMKSPYFIKYADESTHGMNLPRMGTDKARLALFPMTPENEQHRIVAKVDELMALCDRLEKQQTNSNAAHQTLVEMLLATLTQSANQTEFAAAWQRIAEHFDTLFTTEHSIDQLKQTILQLAVMGKLVPQDPNDEPASVLLEKIAEEKARLVKEGVLKTKAKTQIDEKEEYIRRQSGWEYSRLGNLAKFIDYRGRTPEKIESGVPLITAKNVRFGFISREPQEFISETEYKTWMTRGFPKINDILFTTEAPLGNVAIVDIKEKFALAQRVICFQLHEPEIAHFLRILMMSLLFQEQLSEQATGMTATGIKSAKLKEIPVPIPPLAEQHRIVAKVDELMTLCDTLKARIKQAQTTQIHLADTIVEQAVA